MEFNLDKEVTYVPDAFGNKDLDTDEQVSVLIKVPTSAEVNMLFRSEGGKMDTSNMTLGVSRLVKKVANLKVNGKTINNGRDLVVAEGMYMFVQDIGAHILGMLVDLERDPT